MTEVRILHSPPSQTASTFWKYGLDQCDVIDRAKLEQYRAVVPVWLDMLNGDDQHSIAAQITDMLWQDAAWRSMNEARRWAGEDGLSASTSPLLAVLLDRGYVAGQILAIGKLLEAPTSRNPKRGVISLRRLVEEVIGHRDMVTREVFVGHDGLPYDCSPKSIAVAPSQDGDENEPEVTWLETEGPGAWAQSMLLHELFDRLSGVAPDARHREDLIADAVFDRLRSSLDDPVFGDVLALRNKTIAHAADAISRAHAGTLRKGLKLDEFARAHRLLLGTMQALSAGILYGTWRGAAVPIVQHDQFKGLTGPVVTEQRLPSLRAFWRTHCQERDEWLSSAFDDIIPRARGT